MASSVAPSSADFVGKTCKVRERANNSPNTLAAPCPTLSTLPWARETGNERTPSRNYINAAWKDKPKAQLVKDLQVGQNDDKTIEEVVRAWEFYATTDTPHRVDLPALSTLERLTMESNDDAQAMMGFELPTSNMGENPFDVFKKFYRIYPHFSRVEL